MDNLGKAYLWSIIFSIIIIPGKILEVILTDVKLQIMLRGMGINAPGVIGEVLGLIVVPAAIIYIIWVGNLITKDAKSRNLSRHHSAWIFLGVIGVLIYHLGFAKRAASQQPGQQPPQQQYQQPMQQQPPMQQRPMQQQPGQYPQQPGQYRQPQQPQQQYPQQPRQ